MDDLLSTLQGAGPQQQPAAPAQQPQPSSAPAFDPNKSYGTPPQLLNNLRSTESSGDPYAVNKTTGAMGQYQFMPATVAMMRKQGINFDPFNPQQARNAADFYIQQLKQQNGGTYQGALKAYGGFVTKDQTQYVNKVMSGVPTTPGQSNAGDQPQGYQGPMSDLFSTLQAGPQQAQQQAQQKQPPAPPPAAPPTAQQQAIQSAMGLDPISSAVDSAATHTLSGLVGGVAGLGSGIKKAITSGGDFGAANQAWNQTAGNVSNAINNFLTPAGNQTAQQVGAQVASIPGQAIGAVVDAGGNAVGTAAQGMGASPQTSHNLSELTKFGANALLTTVGGRAMLKGRGTPAAAGDAAAATEAPAAGAQAERVEPTMQPDAQAAAAAKPKYRPNGDGTFTQVSEPVPAQPQPAPPVQAQPQGSQSEPVPVASLPQTSGKASDMFPSPDKAPTVGGPLPDAAQAQNRGVVNALGLTRVRDSVINGDAQQAGVEYQNARVSSPIGDVTRATIADEQNAIRNYADRVNDMTGRDSALDAEGVGAKILAPFQKMSDWFDQKAGSLYQQARENAGNVPLKETPALTNLLGDADLSDRMAASPGGQAIYNAVQSRYARFADLAEQAPEVAQDGVSPAPARTINNAENFRQWLNAVGRDNPQYGNFISQVKQALDTDVGAAGGEGLFNEARSMWAQRQQMLADPAQLSKVVGDGDSLNRSIPMEKVGQRVVGMDGANFRNVLDSLSNIEKMAPELGPDVQGALAEIRGQAARQLTDAGGKTEYWNANQFSKTAQTMSPKLKLIFNNQEMGALRTLNEAGRIIRQPGAYPGAAAQHINMFRSGISTALPYAANAIGHAVGGTVGGFVGQAAGNRLSSLVHAGGEAKAAAKLANRYSKNVSQ